MATKEEKVKQIQEKNAALAAKKKKVKKPAPKAETTEEAKEE